MVYIPAGSYYAGSRVGEGAGNEYPRHRVNLQGFYMDKYEMTVGQYGKFIRETGHKAPPGLAIEDSSKMNHPVVGVSREDAIAYAEWAGKRLPTEAEWEYACRAGTTTRYGVGNSIDHDKANYAGVQREGKGRGVAPVGSFAPNAWGLCDMHGNVWEWCRDWYGRNYYAACPADCPQGPPEGAHAVMRGGSWKESERFLRSATRGYYPPGDSRDDLGFRCAK
jgi:formylglycine-generating enzyme required for sulfatase activity